MLPTKQDSKALARDAALVAAQILPLEDLAALHGMPQTELLERLKDPTLRASIERELAQLKVSGALAEARATKLLNAALDSLEETLSGRELSWSAVVKISELLMSVSGARERRKERVDPAQNSFSIIIHLQSEPVALTAKPGAVIDMGDAEVIGRRGS